MVCYHIAAQSNSSCESREQELDYILVIDTSTHERINALIHPAIDQTRACGVASRCRCLVVGPCQPRTGALSVTVAMKKDGPGDLKVTKVIL